MIISHKNTRTLGDFANTWPLLSELSKYFDPLSITLPPIYNNFIGLKDFLEYQDFIEKVDFEDRESDIDVQAHANWNSINIEPIRSYYSANILQMPINRELLLKVEDISIPKEILNKTIIIDRTFNKVLDSMGWFKGQEYYWLDFSKSLSYNINICLKSKKIIATFTGLPIILDLFNKDFDLIWFDDIDGFRAHKEHYFPERNSKLFYYKNYNIIN